MLWYSVGLDLLALVILLLTLTIGYRTAHSDGYEAGYNEGRADRAQMELEERRAERSQRRARAGTSPGRDEDASPVARPARRPAERRPQRSVPAVSRGHVSAADLRPVAIPGPLRPQPGRDSGAGTMTMPAVRSTGELRAVTDAWIADMRASEAAYRKELTS